MKVKQAKAKTLPLRKRDNRFFKSILLVVMALAVFNSTMAKAYDTYGVIVEHIFEDNNNENGERDQLGGITAEVTKVKEETPKDETVYPEDTPAGEPSSEPGGATEEEPYATITATKGDAGVPPVELDEESEKAREELVDRILDASEDGHFTTETAAGVADTVTELIEGTDPANKWSGDVTIPDGDLYVYDRTAGEYNKSAHYQVVISDGSMKALEEAGYKTTSLKIQITTVRNPYLFNGHNYTDYPWCPQGIDRAPSLMGEERIYVSLDNGKTWAPANDAAKLWEKEGVVFDPQKDLAKETVYTYLHVLETTPPSEPPSKPTTPSNPDPDPTPDPDPDPVIDVPQTGDIPYPWYAVAILSACGLVAVPLLKKREEA